MVDINKSFYKKSETKWFFDLYKFGLVHFFLIKKLFPFNSNRKKIKVVTVPMLLKNVCEKSDF